MGETLDCREAAVRLQDYLKRELTPEIEAAMRAHLERCAPCFRYARFEENFVLMLARPARRGGCPGSLRARILGVLRTETGEG